MKLLLRNLCVEVCESELQQLFSIYGKVVRARVLRDEINNTSRGVAIVEMAEGGEAAMKALNHVTYKTQYLVVTEMKERVC